MHILNFTKDWQSASQKGAVGGRLFTFLLAEHKIIVSHTSSPSLVTCFFLIITNLMCVKTYLSVFISISWTTLFLDKSSFPLSKLPTHILCLFFHLISCLHLFFFKNLLYVFRNWSLLDLKKNASISPK